MRQACARLKAGCRSWPTTSRRKLPRATTAPASRLSHADSLGRRAQSWSRGDAHRQRPRSKVIRASTSRMYLTSRIRESYPERWLLLNSRCRTRTARSADISTAMLTTEVATSRARPPKRSQCRRPSDPWLCPLTSSYRHGTYRSSPRAGGSSDARYLDRVIPCRRISGRRGE